MANTSLSAPPDPKSGFDSPAWQGWFYSLFFRYASKGNFTVAALPGVSPTLPNGPPAGSFAYATNGRKVGESAGNGTGVPVYYSNGAWRVYSTDAPVSV